MIRPDCLPSDLSFESLSRQLEGIGCPRILVIGDLMLDRYTWGEAGRVSPEAPVLVLHAGRTEHRLGGAASVAALLRGLDVAVTLAGVVGDDEPAATLRHLLEGAGVDLDLVRDDPTRPTTLKHRLMGTSEQKHAHQIVRLDTESRRAIDGALEAKLIAGICRAIPDADAVLISDYAKGTCTPALLGAAIARGRELRKPVLIDPGRGVDYRRYRGATCLTPNRDEAAAAVGGAIRSVAEAQVAAETLCRRHGLDAALVTLDRDGIVCVGADGRSDHFSTRPRAVADITGAGDVVLAMLGLALGSGLDYPAAITLANVAGGLEVEAVGVVPVTRDEILSDLAAPAIGHLGGSKVVTLRALTALIERRKRQGERIVFTNGCFDLLHPGHLRVLTEARAQGDCLVVGLNSDWSVVQLEGPERPIIPACHRATLLAALEVVDYVCLFDAATPLDLIEAIRPHVLVKGGDYAPEQVVGRDVVEENGGQVVLVPLSRGWSTTALAARLRGAEPALP